MIWLLWTEALIGMLLVAAVLRSKNGRGLYRPQEPADDARTEDGSQTKIHLVPSRPARADVGPGVFVDYSRPSEPAPPVTGALARGVVYLMRQFAVQVLRALWRPRPQ
jgi:hypothetical protein